MPFHVQIRRSIQRAWAFNLEQAELDRAILGPWQQGRMLEVGGKQWNPHVSTLKVLEGPKLADTDLAFGQGWNHAERSARDVTAAVLGDPARPAAAVGVAVLAETDAAAASVAALLTELGVATAEWAALRARILAAATLVAPRRGDPTAAAVVVVERADPSPGWLFEAGLALGALGGRAILVQLGDEPPSPELAQLGVIRLDPQQPASRHALIERLRNAGCDIEAAP